MTLQRYLLWMLGAIFIYAPISTTIKFTKHDVRVTGGDGYRMSIEKMTRTEYNRNLIGMTGFMNISYTVEEHSHLVYLECMSNLGLSYNNVTTTCQSGESTFLNIPYGVDRITIINQGVTTYENL